jgi:hypothetical protein
MKTLEQRLEEIERRNRRVERDKAWETSSTRRLMIVLLTYIVIGLYLSYLGVANAWFHAFVPVIAFLLSTLALSVVRTFWER